MIELRPYQVDLVDRIRGAFRRHKRVLAVAPTGAGKTVVFSFVARTSSSRGKRVLIVAHRRELIRQASAKLTSTGVPHGIIAPGFTPNAEMVQVGSVQTLGRRLDKIGLFDLIVLDESHHAVAGQWADLIATQPAAYVLGVTATPERLDGRGLGVSAGGCFDDMVIGPTIADLIADGYLTPSRVFAPISAPDLTGIATKGGDFDPSGLQNAMDVPSITGDSVAHYTKYAAGLPAIAFCVSVRHAAAVAAAFREAGWRAVEANGSTPAAERDAAIQGLATGATQVLCVCDLVSEGLDIPLVGAVILLRPTKSLGLYVQQVGRGLRPAPGKTHLIVLDHAGNTLRHGLPDMSHAWTLNGRKKRSRKSDAEKGPAVKQCASCFLMNPASARRCIECDAEFEGGREVEVVDGDLAEIDASMLETLRREPLGQLLSGAKTEADLKQIAKAKGYKRGWVQHVLRSRRGHVQEVAA